ncbi:MAG: F0F1 ATP synthase subunit B [Phycisphaeraceae bacterium]|nr:F0F1 ATP synthase subunit B [Phycisphaeraceae bacterium]
MKQWHATGVGLLTVLIASPLWAADAGGKPSLFEGTIYQSIAALVSFTLLFLILRKYAWGPILKGLQDREEKIKGDLEAAEAANLKATETLADYEKKLAEAHSEARSLLDEARKDADQYRQRLQAEAEKEAAEQRRRAADEIDRAKQAALQEMYAQAGALAVDVAGKILQRQIDEDDTQKLINQSLSEMDRLGN